MFGSDSRWMIDWNGFIARSVTVASVTSTVTGCERTSTMRPSAWRRTSSTDVAIASTAPTATASLAVDETALSTVETAHSTSRWRASAIDRMLAIASFLTLSPIVPVSSSPPAPTGDAAPMFVPGAMYARCDASVMNVPALAARPPLGATHTMVGSGASSSADTIRWVASRLPPGVFKVTITAAEPSADACAIPCSM